jgi:hypothetical protein
VSKRAIRLAAACYIVSSLASGLAGCVTADSAVTDRAATLEIILPPPGARKLSGDKGQPNQIGFGRAIPAALQHIALQDLRWTRNDNRYQTIIMVRSSGARSVRLAMNLSAPAEDLAVAVGNGRAAAIAMDLATSSPQEKLIWSPVIDGDTVWIELTAATIPRGVVLNLPQLSHIP